MGQTSAVSHDGMHFTHPEHQECHGSLPSYPLTQIEALGHPPCAMHHVHASVASPSTASFTDFGWRRRRVLTLQFAPYVRRQTAHCQEANAAPR
ncbi:hypothetical protein MHYP_G00140180 [Metynnis hypsauchen]